MEVLFTARPARTPWVTLRVTPLSREAIAAHSSLSRLPLLTLYLTDRCNSRCVTCDYWRHGRNDMDLATVTRLLPSLTALGTQTVLLSGGEPLLNPEWAAIAHCLRRNGLKVWLLTSGLALAKQARRAAELFDAITVSLDGTDPQTYAAIRGLDAFDKVCEGIRAAAAHGMPPSIRVTVQRANYSQLPAFVGLAKRLGARQVSFLAVDVANPHAFGRTNHIISDLALRPEELRAFERTLDCMEQDHVEDFVCGFIAENPQKLRRILHYFAAVRGTRPYPQVRCNAPEFSAVIGATGRVQPCFFIAGPSDAQIRHRDLPMDDGSQAESGAPPAADLAATLNLDSMRTLRHAIRQGQRAECTTCVCSLWRDNANAGQIVRLGAESSDAVSLSESAM